jgi:HK97 family phage prohead protease
MLKKLNNPLADCQVKFSKTEEGVFEGYASTFGNVDSYGDTVVKGAYKKTLEDNPRPKMFFNHDSWSAPIGIWTDLKEDDTGLYVKGEFTLGNSRARDIYESLKHGAVDGMSIGYTLPEGGYEERSKDEEGLILKEINLHEVSVVTFPAETTARVTDVKEFREEISGIHTLRDAELFLRDADLFSRSMATAFVSRLKSVIQRDAEDEIEQIKAQQAAELETFLTSLRSTES